MKKALLIFALALAPVANAVAQTPAAQQTAQGTASADKDITATRVMGEVTAVNVEAKGLAVKTAAGNSVLVMLDDKTQFKRAQPGSASLDTATPITLADVSVGDKVYARGRVAADQHSVPAQLVVVLTKADIAKKQAHDRAEWQQRGVWGTITALNPAAKEITITARGTEGLKPVVIEAASDKVEFMRYAPDSVKFSDARPSSFADLKVGDQLRALGERSADGSKFTPEEVVSGSFKTILGTVTSVDAANHTVTIKPGGQKQTLTIGVTPNTNLRRLDEQAGRFIALMAMRASGGGSMGGFGGGGRFGGPGGQGGGQSPAGGAQRPAGGPPAGGPPAGGGEGAAGGQGGAGGGRRFGGGAGGFDINDMIDRQPQASLADLKPGDVVIVSSTTGADPTRVSAITLLAGAEPVLAALQSAPRRQGGSGPTDVGLPSGFDLGIGLP